MFRNVLGATDLSPASASLLQCLAHLRQMGAGKGTLIHVMNVRDVGGSTCPLRTLCGRPGPLIVEKTRKGNHTLLIIGSQGRGYFAEAFLGRVANHAVHRSAIPVLVIPPQC